VAMSCVKSLLVPYGSHTVFFGNVEEIKIRDDISTLLYQNGDYGVFQPLAREGDASLAQLVGWG
jgi:flavin reductase (DIM6/NTAB) family NADH-FMN oxidoreductase RutF